MRLFAFLIAALMLSGPALAQDHANYDPFADVIVSDDLSALPEPVRAKREQLIAATRTGDIEGLGAIMAAQDAPPTVSFGDPDDAIGYLREQSSDGEGLQMLALMRNLLEMPYAILGASSADPNYVWPYLAVSDLTALTPEQMVDVYRLITPEQFADMGDFGGWFWWRIYIGDDGEWQAFVAGD